MSSAFVARQRSIRSPTPAQPPVVELPPNWGVKATPDGRIYYYNLQTDETRWSLNDGGPSDPAAQQQDEPGASDPDADHVAAAEQQLDAAMSIEWTWPGLTNQIVVHIHSLTTAIRASRKEKYVPAASAIVEAIRVMLYASGTAKRDSPAIVSNRGLKILHKQILSALSKLVLAAKTASGVWPPPDSVSVLNQVNNDVLVAVRSFTTVAAENNIPITPLESDASAAGGGSSTAGSVAGGSSRRAPQNDDDDDDANAPPTSAELLNLLEQCMRRTVRLVADLADPVQVRTLRIKTPEPGASPTEPSASRQTSLISVVRSIVKEVGAFFELVDELPIESLSNDLTVDYKVNRLALTNSISNLVGSTSNASNALLSSNAMQEISAAARVVERSFRELLIATKFLIEEKENVEQMNLLTYIEQQGRNARPVSGDAAGRQRRAMSMTFSQAQDGSGAAPPPPMLSRGVTVSGSMSAAVPSEPSSAGFAPYSPLSVPYPPPSGTHRISTVPPSANNSSEPPIPPEWDDEFPMVGKRTSKLRRILGDEAVPVVKPKPDVPWYLQYDYNSSDIILNMENNIRGGTLKALVEKLTLHDSVDANFVLCFLITYKSFTNSKQLFSLLEQRFLLPQPEGLTPGQLAEWTEKKLTPIRLRVFNVLKSWIENYLGQDPEDMEALLMVRHFAETKMAQHMSAASIQLVRLIDRRRENGPSLGVGRLVAVAATREAPPPILPKNLRRFKFLDLDPLEVARQLTIKESEIFSQIQISEFLNKAWSRKDQPDLAQNVKRMSSMSNQVIAWVGATILGEPDLRKRAKTMAHFILVAEKCASLNNYSSLMNIIGTLDSAHVHRLRKTWELVPTRQMATYEALRETMSPARNFANYRGALHSVNPPAVPFLGCYLTDLTFIADGNPDTLKARDDMINFAKMAKTAETLREIQQFQHIRYALTKVPEIQEFLDSVLIEDATETEFYDMSLSLEPRTGDK
nr:hypothetical protein HK105_002352 [Polyrhizophydium stewartii]